MVYLYLPALIIALLAFVALTSLADAVSTQPAPPTVIVQYGQERNGDAPVAIVLAIMLGLLVMILSRG